MRRDVFQAIADPTRRDIIDMVAREPMNLNAIADRFEISRPAISKHVKILVQCGLVRIRQEGRERICDVSLKPLRDVSVWAEQYRLFWTGKLDALESFLEQEKKLKSIKNKR